METLTISIPIGAHTLNNLTELCQLLAIYSEDVLPIVVNNLIGIIGVIQPEEAIPEPVIDEIIQCIIEAVHSESSIG